MPIYEYKCNDCKLEFEFFHKSQDTQKDKVECPSCGGTSLTKQFSAFAVNNSPSFGGGQTCCGMDSPDSASCAGPGSCCGGNK